MDNQTKRPTVSNPLEQVVMLQALTLDDVKGWDFIGTTPARKRHYFNDKLDVAAYIYSKQGYMQFWYNRKCNGNTAICFSDNLLVELAS